MVYTCAKGAFRSFGLPASSSSPKDWLLAIRG